MLSFSVAAQDLLETIPEAVPAGAAGAQPSENLKSNKAQRSWTDRC